MREVGGPSDSTAEARHGERGRHLGCEQRDQDDGGKHPDNADHDRWRRGESVTGRIKARRRLKAPPSEPLRKSAISCASRSRTRDGSNSRERREEAWSARSLSRDVPDLKCDRSEGGRNVGETTSDLVGAGADSERRDGGGSGCGPTDHRRAGIAQRDHDDQRRTVAAAAGRSSAARSSAMPRSRRLTGRRASSRRRARPTCC